jgi:integrase/recombinase XerC
VRAYTLDVIAFARWFKQTTGREFGPGIVDPMDIGEYRGFLIQRGKQPATVNRRLIALRRFFEWTLKEGQVQTRPFDILERVFVKE